MGDRPPRRMLRFEFKGAIARIPEPPPRWLTNRVEALIARHGGPLRGIGDNSQAEKAWREHCWRKARAAAGKSPPIEVVRRRARRAAECGMTYEEYTLEILERGRYL